MRGLAHLLANRDISITAQDHAIVDANNEADLARFNWVTSDEATKIATQVDLVVRSDAVPEDNAAVRAAANAGVTNLIYSEALGELTGLYTTIAIAGTHGKTSTTALLAHILITAGLDPTVSIGARVPAWDNRNALIGGSDLFIVEADEYRNHFHQLRPAHAIITSIDFDHPDFFTSLDDTNQSFQTFIDSVQPDGAIVVPEHVAAQHPLNWPDTTIRVPNGVATKNIPGEPMRMNAALAVAIAETLGVTPANALASLDSYAAVARRLEELGTSEGTLIVSDYGHHPAEISATLAAAREKYADKRIAVLFEAHTLERIATFTAEFAVALATADEVMLVPVFVPAGREGEQMEAAKAAADDLQLALKDAKVKTSVLADYDQLPQAVHEIGERADIVLGFTAGVLDGHLRQLPNLS
jgi:UDP-N-acetylmuramate--alanine ligase